MKWKTCIVVLSALLLGLSLGEAVAEEYKNQLFFRGGGAFLTNPRSNELLTDANGATGRFNDNTVGYYIGAGVEHQLTKFWGNTLLGEVGLEYKRFNSNKTVLAGGLAAGQVNTVQLTMLTVDFAPKYRFETGRLRPWIIPIGLDFVVISPPSSNITVLDIGVQWGAGADFRLTDQLSVGVDGRFHLATGQTGTTNNFGTIGAFVGINF